MNNYSDQSNGFMNNRNNDRSFSHGYYVNEAGELITHNELPNFILPSWKELPFSVRSNELLEFVNKHLEKFFGPEACLTKTMIQNYLKLNILPPIQGRKYAREHVAWCLAIGLLKQVLPIIEIKKGIYLCRQSSPAEILYAQFRDLFHIIMKNGTKNIFANVHHSYADSRSVTFDSKYALLVAAIEALAMRIYISWVLKDIVPEDMPIPAPDYDDN